MPAESGKARFGMLVPPPALNNAVSGVDGLDMTEASTHSGKEVGEKLANAKCTGLTLFEEARRPLRRKYCCPPHRDKTGYVLVLAEVYDRGL